LKTGWATGPVPLRTYRSAAKPAYHRCMHGVIFASFRDFALTRFGPETAKEILAGRPVHVMSDAYDDREFDALVRRTSEVAGVSRGDLVHDFGGFAGGTTFPRLYPAFFAVAGGTRPFLLTVEDRIHELVRATIPNARPPQLVVEPLGDEGVRITYTSPRRLCGLLAGLLEGTASHFGDTVTYEQTTCMHRGDEACVFDVRISSLASAA
jgi:Haem-NO-binding